MGIISWFLSDREPEEPSWLRRWLFPRPGRDDPKLDEIKEAAAADVAAMEEENRRHFRQYGPGHRENDL
jgi:hypothetical protein